MVLIDINRYYVNMELCVNMALTILCFMYLRTVKCKGKVIPLQA